MRRGTSVWYSVQAWNNRSDWKANGDLFMFSLLSVCFPQNIIQASIVNNLLRNGCFQDPNADMTQWHSNEIKVLLGIQQAETKSAPIGGKTMFQKLKSKTVSGEAPWRGVQKPNSDFFSETLQNWNQGEKTLMSHNPSKACKTSVSESLALLCGWHNGPMLVLGCSCPKSTCCDPD